LGVSGDLGENFCVFLFIAVEAKDVENRGGSKTWLRFYDFFKKWDKFVHKFYTLFFVGCAHSHFGVARVCTNSHAQAREQESPPLVYSVAKLWGYGAPSFGRKNFCRLSQIEI
jgi:hypothetical protein